jgi:hypothetical protein
MALLISGPARAGGEPQLEFAFEEVVTLAGDVAVGPTALGGRNIVPITGGTFGGPGIAGKIMPGGWDWQLRRTDGCLQIKADYMLQTDDGTIINVVNQGVACPPEPGKAPAIRTHPVFEVPMGKYGWLARETFVGTLVPETRPGETRSVRIRFYRVK